MFRRVSELNVQCALRVRNFNSPGIAMSDCCGRPANAAVRMEDGKQMWRCEEHRNIRRLEMGPSVSFVKLEEA